MTQPSDKPTDPWITDIFETLPKLLDAESELLRAGRWLNVDCLLGPAGRPFLVSIREGRITEMSASVGREPWRNGPPLCEIAASIRS